jgi:hypothetical protein
LKSVDDSLQNHPQHFWKYVSNFKRKDNSYIQLRINDQFVTDPKHIADAFSTYFESIFNTSCLSVTPSDTVTSDFLPTAPITAAAVSRAIKRLRPSKCDGLDGIPSLVIKCCSDIFIPLLTYNFNLSVTSVAFPSLWKQTAVAPVFKKGNSTTVSYYRPLYILNNFSKISEFIIYDHLNNFFKCRLNPSQHGFHKFSSSATNLFTYLNSVIPSVSTQGQNVLYILT